MARDFSGWPDSPRSWRHGRTSDATSRRLIRSDIGFANGVLQNSFLLLQIGQELGMPHTHGLEAGLRELSGHLGVRLQNRDFIGQTLDDPGIRVRGSQQALPGLDLQIAKSRRLRKTWSLGP